jgi:hypothetical protein
MKKYEFGKRIHRYSVTKSKKTLGDIYILNYYFNMGKKIVIKNLEKLLFFRYNNFTKKILSHQMS